jgi:hypothetical protein
MLSARSTLAIDRRGAYLLYTGTATFRQGTTSLAEGT